MTIEQLPYGAFSILLFDRLERFWCCFVHGTWEKDCLQVSHLGVINVDYVGGWGYEIKVFPTLGLI